MQSGGTAPATGWTRPECRTSVRRRAVVAVACTRAEPRAAEGAGAVSPRPALGAAPENGETFVQHRIAAESDAVWPLPAAGARAYVCGGGSRMAPGRPGAFRTLYRDRTPGAGDTAAGAWLDGLIADGRQVEDVCAAG
ncbi:hypothetical protein [Streptomyces sp. NBC_00080]|uniref:hypothetical protein n=1 Tax=Streptomyces sp. NBC_00080 TaxID=2975645 RepID=UPI00386FDA7B